jgi:hypothetical protein
MTLYNYESNDYINGEWIPTILKTGGCYSYGDFRKYEGEVTEALKKSLYILPELLTGSDYSGGSVERANHKVFLERFKEIEGVYSLSGGMGTFAIAVRMNIMEDNPEIKEVLDALESYASIDDEAVSEIESEWETEAMKDIVHSLCNHISLEDYIPDFEPNSDIIANLAWESINELNLHWYHENTSAYLDYKEVQPYIEDMLLIEHCMDLPLLINREWSCKNTENKYREKLQG